MENNNIEQEVIALVARVAEIPESEISLSSNLLGDIGLESLDVVTLVAEFENEFKMIIPDQDIKTIQTVEDIVNYIKSRG